MRIVSANPSLASSALPETPFLGFESAEGRRPSTRTDCQRTAAARRICSKRCVGELAARPVASTVKSTGQSIRLRRGQCPQCHGIKETENRRVRANPQREGNDGDCGKSRTLNENPKGAVEFGHELSLRTRSA